MIYLSLFFNFFKIGLFTFGGGYAMIPLIQQTVLDKGWCEAETFIDYVAVAESTPGPIAVNSATFIGNDVAGFFGALSATFGVVLPSFIIIIIVARFFMNFSDLPVVKNALLSLRAMVVGLICASAARIFVLQIINDDNAFLHIDLKSAAIFIVIFSISRIFKKISPIAIIALSALSGLLIFSGIF